MRALFLFILGILLVSIGLFFCILNLNLLTVGYSFLKYVKFIISNIECNVLFFGICLIVLVYERGKI